MRSLLLLAALLAPANALATDPSTLDVNLEGIPDMIDLFRRQRPIMGQCPMGEQEGSLASAEHVLHLGTTGFYLDYARRLDLTEEQRSKLEGVRDSALRVGAEQQQRIDKAEAELWRLTGTDATPAELEAQVRAIGKLRDDQRWGYLEAVREAAGLLTSKQSKRLVGG